MDRKYKPSFDELEFIVLPATLNWTDYAYEGTKWPNIANLTYSIVPDGTSWDHGTSNFQSTMQTDYGSSWVNAVDQAMETWASVLGLTFHRVSDNGADFDAIGLAEGDPHFGDIRIGGFAFPDGNGGTDLSTTAHSYPPPPQGWTAGGDISVNTAIDWKSVDLYSVLLHEIGHSLGLDHAKYTTEVMYPSYTGKLNGLGPGDQAGFAALYGVFRAPVTVSSSHKPTKPPTKVAVVKPVKVNPPTVLHRIRSIWNQVEVWIHDRKRHFDYRRHANTFSVFFRCR